MVSGIILAAGFSRRLGRDKLLLEINHGPIIENVIRAAVKSSLDEIILVYRRKVVKAIADSYRIKTIQNEDAKNGQSTSVVKGIRAANAATDAYLFMVGDQPFLNSETINCILDCHVKKPDQIIVPLYNDHAGTPVLFPVSFQNDLLLIRGDTGGRSVIQAFKDRVTHIGIEQSSIGYDVDTMEDFENIKK
jgi:molybdenum cofactor cytidylyltransferase